MWQLFTHFIQVGSVYSHSISRFSEFSASCFLNFCQQHLLVCQKVDNIFCPMTVTKSPNKLNLVRYDNTNVKIWFLKEEGRRLKIFKTSFQESLLEWLLWFVNSSIKKSYSLIYGWVSSLFTERIHNIDCRIYFNTKCFQCLKKN